MYNQREKAQRDYEWGLAGARQEGLEQGFKQGLQKGKLAGRIQNLQERLNEAVTSDAELGAADVAQLTTQLADLQQRLRDRQA